MLTRHKNQQHITNNLLKLKLTSYMCGSLLEQRKETRQTLVHFIVSSKGQGRERTATVVYWYVRQVAQPSCHFRGHRHMTFLSGKYGIALPPVKDAGREAALGASSDPFSTWRRPRSISYFRQFEALLTGKDILPSNVATPTCSLWSSFQYVHLFSM